MARILELTSGLALGLAAWCAGTILTDSEALGDPVPSAPTAALQPVRAPAVASYSLKARLDAETHRIDSHGTLTFWNTSREPISELWFHLYLNAFKNDGTLFLRSPFHSGRGGKREHAWGYIDVKRLVLKSTAENLWPKADSHTPGDPADQTDIRVPLPAPLPPGESIELELAFESQLPEIVERTGYTKSYHFVGQWFPKLAVLEPDGTWKHFAFHPQSEFYADFGDYRVELEVPEAFSVGATGRIISETHSGGVKHITFLAEGVHDFAWTAYDRFRERSETISSIQVRVLYPPGYDHSIDKTLAALRFAIPDFGRRYGAYPYSTLTVVHPPELARRSGGMEYPTLITTGSPWFVPALGARAVEIVTIHELGHQWFYGIMASDEHRSPFLDEGINSYAEGVALSTAYGAGSLLDFGGVKLSVPALRRIGAVERVHASSVATGAHEFASFTDMGALVYGRTALLLSTLAAVYGEQQMERALAAYTERHRFKHPTADDLLSALSEHLGEQARTVAQRGLTERGWVDFVAEDLRSTRLARRAGVFDRDSGRETLARAEPSESDDWWSSVTLYRHGSLSLPVDVELTAEDGSRLRRHWDGQGSHETLTHQGSSPIVSVLIDPDRRVLLDQNLLNNAATRKVNPLPRLWERALYMVELALGVLAP